MLTGLMNDFGGWLRSAKSGSVAIYYTGFIMADRYRNITVVKIASAAWNAYLQGKVILVQRKLGVASYDYIAIKR